MFVMQATTVNRVAKASGEASKLLQDYSRKSAGKEKVGLEVLEAAKAVLAPRIDLIRKTKELIVVRHANLTSLFSLAFSVL